MNRLNAYLSAILMITGKICQCSQYVLPVNCTYKSLEEKYTEQQSYLYVSST